MTLRKVERGEPSVAIGIVFEVAVLLGIDLLGTPEEVHARTRRVQESLALLPPRVRHPRADAADDDFCGRQPVAAMTPATTTAPAFAWVWLPAATEPVVAGR